MFDIIPDIHGDIARLEGTLKTLGYQRNSTCWQHPDERTAVFLGDFIDTGHENARVISTVRAMIDANSAVAVMGNHELNAIHYHSEGKNGGWVVEDGWMRAHTEKNNGQHETFLREYPLGASETGEIIDWFMSLPLFLDIGEFRVIHACWDMPSVGLIRKRRPDGRLNTEDLQEVAADKTDFARAVNRSLKGPEMALPNRCKFHDKRGHLRNEIRLKWWEADATTWREAALSVPDINELPIGTLPTDDLDFNIYSEEDKPVFVGHYKMEGSPRILSSNATCLDFPNFPCAYRWEECRRSLADDQLFQLSAPPTIPRI